MKRYIVWFFAFLVISLWPSHGLAAQLKLAWDANVDSDLSGYRVYYGVASRSYGSPVDVGNVTSHTLTGLTQGQTYFVALTAYDSIRNESVLSNEVSGIATEPSRTYVVATVGTNPSGLQVVVDQRTYATPVTFAWPTGASHTLSVPSPQNEIFGTRYAFGFWNDGRPQSHAITVPSSNVTYMANFEIQYSLNISVNPAGGGTVTPLGTTWHNAGRTTSISASPSAGSTFEGWSGDISTGANPASITMTRPMSAVANFRTGTAQNPMPDLTGSWIAPVTQTCKGIGKNWKCSLAGVLRVSNTGNATVSSSDVSFYLSSNGTYETGDNLLKQVSLNNLAPGVGTTLNFGYSVTSKQTANGKYVIAVIDRSNSVLETNEGNNAIVSAPIQ